MGLKEQLKEKADAFEEEVKKIEDEVKTEATHIYEGIYSLVDSLGRKIKPILGVYVPLDDVQVKELEVQVARGIVTKTLGDENGVQQPQ